MNLTLPEEFPWRESERLLVKKKILMFLAWCSPEKCRECPVYCISPETRKNTTEDTIIRFLHWIMEAEIE